MPDAKTLDAHYKALSDLELLKIRAEGGFTLEAEQILDSELARRNLTREQANRHFAPEWLHRAGTGAVGILELESGERITAEVIGLNKTGDRLSVKVISPDSPDRNGRPKYRAISFHKIVTFELQPHLMEQWPLCDPCRRRSSRPRLLLMSSVFLGVIVGSVPLYLTLMNRRYGLQEASIISFTLFVVFFTFARHGAGYAGPTIPPFMFTCPAVRPQIPRLLWRHLAFLIALVALQTAALAMRPNLPDWWNVRDKRGGTPFALALLLLCFGLAWAEILSSRSLLNRAHREFSAEYHRSRP